MLIRMGMIHDNVYRRDGIESLFGLHFPPERSLFALRDIELCWFIQYMLSAYQLRWTFNIEKDFDILLQTF